MYRTEGVGKKRRTRMLMLVGFSYSAVMCGAGGLRKTWARKEAGPEQLLIYRMVLVTHSQLW